MQNLLTCPLSLLAQVEYSYSSSSQGQAPGPVFCDLLVGVRHFDDRGALESFHKSRTTRLGIDYPNLKHLLLVQDRGPARLVGNFDVDSNRKSHHLDHPLHRLGKKLRKRHRFWNWFAFAAVYFLSNPRLRQRPVPRAIGIIRDGSFSATAACLGTDSGRRF